MPVDASSTFEPTYQMHGHIARLTGATVVEGERGPDFRLDVDAAVELIAATSAVGHVPVLAQQPDRARRAAVERAEACWPPQPGLLVVDEAYGQFADWSALTMLDESTPLVVTRTFSKTWSMAAARLGYLVGPSWLVAELDKVALPYHLDAAKQIAGRLALQFTDEMDARVARDRHRTRADLSDAQHAGRSTCFRAAPTSSSSDLATSQAGMCGRSCSIAAS